MEEFVKKMAEKVQQPQSNQEANKRKEPKEREIELPMGYSHTHADKKSMKLWKATNIQNFLEDPPLYKSCDNIFSYFLITC